MSSGLLKVRNIHWGKSAELSATPLPYSPNRLEWMNEWMWSRSVVSDSSRPHGLWPTRLLHSWDSPGKSTGVGCHFLLQGIFPTQGLNPGLPHCRQTLYHLSHQGSLNPSQKQQLCIPPWLKSLTRWLTSLPQFHKSSQTPISFVCGEARSQTSVSIPVSG